jgi:hypothetical protein
MRQHFILCLEAERDFNRNNRLFENYPTGFILNNLVALSPKYA